MLKLFLINGIPEGCWSDFIWVCGMSVLALVLVFSPLSSFSFSTQKSKQRAISVMAKLRQVYKWARALGTGATVNRRPTL